MRTLLLFLLLLSLSSVLSQRAAAEPPLRIATGELPPYAGAELPQQGVALHIVRRAFELGGLKVEFHFLPWSRAQAETLAGRWDASAHWGATPQRRRDFLLSDNLYTEQWLMLHRRGESLAWDGSVASLRPHRLGLVRDYTYTPEIWAAARSGQLRQETPVNDASGLRMLLLNRIDVLPLDRRIACHLLMGEGFDEVARVGVQAHSRPMTEGFSTHVLFPRGLAASPARREAFNRGLARLRASGEYQRLTAASLHCPKGL